jgi:autotransporter-associated beta strand protein
MKPLKPLLLLAVVLVLTLSLFEVQRASAGTVYWVGTNGVSATTNWSDAANFDTGFPSGSAATPYNNESQFGFNTAVQSPGQVTVNVDGPNPINSGGVEPTPQTYDMSFVFTNGYHTVLIQPGVELLIQAYNGTPSYGMFICPAGTGSEGNGGGNAVGTGPYTNHVVFWGTNASFSLNGALYLDAEATASENHYSILDMSGLDNFIWNNSTAGSTAESFEIAAGGHERSQALVYLAKTNILNNGSDVSIGYVGNTYSNSQPIGLYLGISNSIVTGHGGNGNELQLGLEGCVAGAFLKFNPAFLGGPNKPTAYLSGTGSSSFPTVSGMMGGAVIGRSDGASVPSIGTVDFTGGIVTWYVGQIQLGRGGSFSAFTTNSATGVLSFDDGTITANDVWCGWQQTSFASSGAPGIGIINVGANATLQVSNILRLGLVTGTQAPGTAGALNVNGGTVILNLVTNAPGATGDVIALTNANLGVSLNQVGITNIPVTTLSLGGATNILNILAITPELGTTYPVRFHVINYQNLVGTLNVGLGSLPATYNPSYPYVGKLDTTMPGFIDVVLTAGPPSARILTWSGVSSGSSNGTWDVATTANWLTNGVATIYNQYDLVSFSDAAATGSGATNISMSTTLTPYALTFSNSMLAYSLGGGGNISGSVTLLKLGTSSLLLDDSGGNNFSGGMLISGGTVQVGNGDDNGNLGSGAVTNNGTLLFNRGAQANVANLIAGSGGVLQEGGDTLTLSGANTYTGTTLATNSSTLQAGSTTAFGGSGTLTIASGSTLDVDGQSLGSKPIVVSGVGSGNGVIISSAGGPYDNSGGGGGVTTSLTLASNATFYFGSSRWDLGAGGTLNTGGKPYNLTLSGSGNYSTEWRNIVVDTNLANITIASGGLGVVGSTQLGNATNSLILPSGSQLTFYNNGSANVNVNKQFIMNDGATIANGGGVNVMSGGLLLTNSGGSQYCTFSAGATSLTLNNVITGNATLYQQDSTSGTLVIAGNTPCLHRRCVGVCRLDDPQRLRRLRRDQWRDRFP